MKILGLYRNPCAAELFHFLQEQHQVYLCTDRLSPEWCAKMDFDLTVSYTYPYILTTEILDVLHRNVVNLHNSFLPWNRGADPNLWSILEGTPRGVTLHYMSEHLDGGEIIAQCIVPLRPEDTLNSSYYQLDAAAKGLFQDAFLYYKDWPGMSKKALGKGSYHSVKDGACMRALITDYQMRISDFRASYYETLQGSETL